MSWFSKYFEKVKYVYQNGIHQYWRVKDESLYNVYDISEVFLPMHRKASDFSTGKLIITDLKGNPKTGNYEERNALKVLLQGSKFMTYEQTLYQYLTNKNLLGISYFYVLKGASISDYLLLENQELEFTPNNNVSLIEADSVTDLISNVYYTSNSKKKTLEKDNIIFVYDIGMNQTTLEPRNRFDHLKKDLKLAGLTKDALIGAMNRTALMLLCDDNTQDEMPVISTALVDDSEAKKNNEGFQSDYNLKKGGIHYIPKKLKALNTNPDNGKLKAFESLEFCQRVLSSALDVPYELFFAQKSTFNNQEKVLQKYVADLKAEGTAFGSAISKYLGWKNSTLKLDFSELEETLLSGPDTKTEEVVKVEEEGKTENETIESET